MSFNKSDWVMLLMGEHIKKSLMIKLPIQVNKQDPNDPLGIELNINRTTD